MSLTRLLIRYQTVKILHEEKGYSIQDLCPLVHIARSSYYKWLNHPKSRHELESEKISVAIQQIYAEHPDKGHRRIRDDLEKDYGILTSNKRILNPHLSPSTLKPPNVTGKPTRCPTSSAVQRGPT